jgi:hypothetical protein
MFESKTNGRTISQNEKLNLEKVTSLTIANYSDVKLLVTLDDVTEVVPAYNENVGYPASFDITGDGTYSNVIIQLVFDTTDKSTKVGNAVLRYKKIIINQDKC